jgi:hypothetical protein
MVNIQLSGYIFDELTGDAMKQTNLDLLCSSSFNCKIFESQQEERYKLMKLVTSLVKKRLDAAREGASSSIKGSFRPS